MEKKVVRKMLHVSGMVCTGCERIIQNALKNLNGVLEVKASFSGSSVFVAYDTAKVDIDEIVAAINDLEYVVKDKPVFAVDSGKKPEIKQSGKLGINQFLGIGIIMVALYMIIKNTVGFNFIPEINQSMSYGILFMVGLLTSIHCIAMCGGVNLSQCISYKPKAGDKKFTQLKPSLLYNFGRVIAYTIVGGIVGALGSVISFSGAAKGIVAIIAGVFMVIMGLNMLNVFLFLRKINIRMPKIFADKIYNNESKHGPLYVGLLTSLMPCGPLQSMQLYALGTGSFMVGALSMFFFSLGTVPLMFGFGALSTFLSTKFTHRMLKVSAVMVMALGVIMVSRGLSLSGISTSFAAPTGGNVAKVEGNAQVVETTIGASSYTPIIVEKGIPVKWTIKVSEADLNGCNNAIIIPKYGIEKKLEPGDNVIEFTPTETGDNIYTCWMGMISSNIKVVDDLGQVSQEDVDTLNSSSATSSSGGSCCSAGSKATKFAGGKIPTDNIYVAKVENGKQTVTITVNDQGFSPAVIVLQRGAKVKIKFSAEKLNQCNYAVVFPEYQGQLDLSQGQLESPELEVTQDFTFQCWMGMLNGYFAIVEDLKKVDLQAIKKKVEAYRPAGGGGCCGS